MKVLATLVGALFLLTACATGPVAEQKSYQVTCRTHARTATFKGSPDEQAHYLECMKIMGRHDVEVTEIK